MPRYTSMADRLIANSYEDAETGCWIWTGAINSRGYPRLAIRFPGRPKPVQVYAHRMSLKVFAGKLSDHHQAHHTCLVSRCINPAHLEGMTRKIHRKRHQQLRRRAAQVGADGGEAQA